MRVRSEVVTTHEQIQPDVAVAAKSLTTRLSEPVARLSSDAKLHHAMMQLAPAAPSILGMVVGFGAGYAISTLAESTLHDKIHHAEPEVRKGWDSLGGIGTRLKTAYLGHTGVHHGATYKADHVTQFSSEQARDKLAQKLTKSGHEELVKEEFGVTVGWRGVAKFLAPVAPVYAASAGAAIALGASPISVIAGALAMPLLPIASRVFHRYMHMTEAQIDQQASTPMRWFMKSSIGKWVTRRHFVHHAREEGVNFNLLPGGDILRGKDSMPTKEEMAEMRRLKMNV